MSSLWLWFFNPQKALRRFIIGSLFSLITAFFILQYCSGSLVAGAIEKAVGVPVQIGGLHFSVSPFELGIYKIKIKNPPGYEEKYLTSIPEIFVRIRLSALFARKIQIEKISLNLDQLTLERNKKGLINLQEVLDKLKKKNSMKPVPEGKPAPPSPKPQPTPKTKTEPFFKLQIDEAVLSIHAVRYIDHTSKPPVVREITLNIKEAKLHNVLDFGSLAEQAMTVILEKIGIRILNNQIDKAAANLQVQAAELVNQAKNKLSSIFH